MNGYGTPFWNINGTSYYWNRLPPIYTLHFNVGEFSLSVEVTTAINNTSFQCVVDGLESAIGYLFVQTPESSTNTTKESNLDIVVDFSTTSSTQRMSLCTVYTCI